ncbi:MAG TPA: ABATE domain-containing protein [Terriglobales bacterium]|nr:ABATE domain-containing protein [Terriglobales bacterium]
MAEAEVHPDPLCVRFVNTVDWRDDPVRRSDPLKSYSDLLRWASDAGAIPPRIAHQLDHEASQHPAAAQAVFTHAILVREALASVLAAAVQGKQPPGEDLQRFNAALGQSGEHLRLAGGKGEFHLDWDSDNSFERVLWPMVRSAADLVTSSDLHRLRTCEGEGCGWFFLDTTRNRSRRWCNMASCGNRAKVRRFYERHKGQ